MIDEIDENENEQRLRLAALSLAHEGFQHQGAEVVLTAAEEYLDFLLDGFDEDEEEGDLPLDAPNGEPIVARFHLTLEAVIYLGTLVATSLEYGRATGIPDDNAVSEFGLGVLSEVNDTLSVHLNGAQV